MDNIAVYENSEFVDFHIYNCSKGEGGNEPGFYFNIPTGIEGDAIFLDGPYPTQDSAILAAKNFIIETLRAYVDEDVKFENFEEQS